MAGGLLALLDDVAVLARLAAASADDVATAAGRAGVKTVGVVIDDAAVTPSYVVGLPPERELPIIFKIAWGSLQNKLVFILPMALLLSAFLPWALTPILMIGGLYLGFEGAEKILSAKHDETRALPVERIESATELEDRQVAGAIRTDFILSAEIMVITLNELGSETPAIQAMVLALVGTLVTIAVYGAVGILVKLDDIGLHLSKVGGNARGFGRGLVRVVPVLLSLLSKVGTAAMLWVSGGILLHGLDEFGIAAPERIIHDLAHAVSKENAVIAWTVEAAGAAFVGMAIGTIVVVVLRLFRRTSH